MQELHGPENAEPRWPALLALLALGGLYAALPSSLLVGGTSTELSVALVGVAYMFGLIFDKAVSAPHACLRYSHLFWMLSRRPKFTPRQCYKDASCCGRTLRPCRLELFS
jgi:hypothetical protein